MEIQIKKKTFNVILVLLTLLIVAILYQSINTFKSNNSAMKKVNFEDVNTSGKVNITIETTVGNIDIELNGEKSPITVENFVRYVTDSFYDGLLFHRVVDSFVIQGGGFEKGMKKREATYPPIENEARKSWLENKRGTIAMARTDDPDSATTEFFINLADNDFLNPGGNDFYGYAVFGKVVSGMDIVDKIGKIQVQNLDFYQDVPVKDVIIKNILIKP